MKGIALRRLAAWTLLATAGAVPYLAGSTLVAGEWTLVPPGYLARHWSTDSGLPANNITALAQTADDYLWVGTWFGLARFNGLGFVIFDRYNTDALAANDAIRALAVDQAGALWIGTGAGLVCHQNRAMVPVVLPGELAGMAVSQIVTEPGGGVWLRLTGAGGDEVGLLVDGIWKAVLRSSQIGAGIRLIVSVPGGGVLAVTSRDVIRVHPDARTETQPPPPDGPSGGRLSPLAVRGERTLWFAEGKGFFLQAGAVWTRVGASGEANWQLWPFGHLETNGTAWVSWADHGLQRWEGRTLEPFTAGRPHETTVGAMLRDAEGSLWLGSSDGLIQLRRPILRTIGKRDGLPGDAINSVCAARDGGIWVGTDGGVGRISPTLAATMASGESAGVGGIGSVWEDQQGFLWAVVHDRGVRGLQRGGLIGTKWPGENGAGALFEDRSGSLWFSRGRGVVCVPPNPRSEDQIDITNFPPFEVRAIHEDGDGNFWFGTYGGGVARLRPEQARDPAVHSTILTTKDGLADDRAFAFHHDAGGALWIGTHNGLTRLPSSERAAAIPRRAFTFRREQGLPENLINHILEDDSGHLWLSGLRGIHRVARAELEAVAAGRSERVNAITFGTSDGMVSSETNGERQPAGCRTPDGRLWFPTGRGVVVVDPREVQLNERPPQVVVEQVIDDRVVIFGDGAPRRPETGPVHLKAGRARVLEFRFTANSLVAPEKNRFEYRLDGLDPDWREAGTERAAFYTTLKPGSYRFHVRAANNHGVRNESLEPFAFTLAPFVWQTTWFRVALALALAAAVVVYLRRRLALQRRILKLEETRHVHEERARITRDLHDDLGARLARLALISELPEGRATGRPIDRPVSVSSLARAAARALDAVVWSVNPRNDTLDRLLDYLAAHAQEFLSETQLRLHLDFPAAVPATPLSSDFRHQILMAVQEALTNILKHAAATEVRLTARIQDGVGGGPSSLELEISDNGRGFCTPDQLTTNSEPGTRNSEPRRSGNGLANLDARLTHLGGQCGVQSRPGDGTTVLLRIPLRD